MDIYNSNGVKLEYSEVLANLPITESCEHVEELMKADHIVLSWRDSEKYTLPVGAYITYKGVNYALLEPYEPEQKSDDEFEYTPNFQHPKMYLGKVPFRFPTTDTEGNSITLLEWPYSGDIDTLLTFFCRTMESELSLTANTFNYSILGEIDMVVSTTFNAVDILSALSNVANQLKCEWHIDWDYKILYFGHIELSRDEVDETVLEVGVNVGTPSVRSSKEGFYNTYEPQGSTRNISKRAASGEYVQGDVRLALNVEDYPDKVIYTNESGTVIASLPQGVKKYVKPLIFDNIYPKLDLYVYDVRCRERYLLDDNGEKIVDHYDGSTPIYKRYAVWYMRLAYPTKVDGHVTAWTDYTINPETDIISGKNLGGAFQPNNYNGAESFPLAGRGNADDGGYGFELNYHTTAETIPANPNDGDTGVIIKAGDYEIVFQQQNDYILPTTASQGIIPKGVKVNGQEVTDLNGLTNLDDGQKGNIVDLYNIVIGSAYTESAQDELAQETLKYITNQFKDNNSYTLKSDVVAFKKRIDQDELLHTDSSLYIGEKVIYKNGDYELETRVMKLVTKLDYAFVQEITVGNEVLKGSTTTLKEQVQTILSGGVGNGSGGGGVDAGAVRKIVQAYANPRFLSKLNDDTAQGFITMLKGLQVGANFVPDILGEGGCLRMRQDGKVELVTDILYARMRAYFDSVVIREYHHESGNRIVSPAQGFNASRVAYIKVVNNEETIVEDASDADYFRCYWRVDDGEKKTENQFIIGDLAFCEHADVVNGSLVTKRYWRVVRGRNAGNTTTEDGEAWIDLSNAHNANGAPVMTTISWEGQGGVTQTLVVKSFESSTNGIPETHDDICMLGCVVDTTRQGAIIEYVSGTDAPTYQIYQGLGSNATNPYTLSNRNQISFGYNSSTGKAYMNVYGDTYIGDKNRSTYIEYKQDDGTPQHKPVLNIKAKVQILPNGSTINGQSIPDYIKDNQNNYDDTAIVEAIGGLEETTEELQKQIDGAIETWFMTGVPTLQNAPANEWTTDDEKDKHIGDLYYDKATGHGYRFMYDDEEEVYLWTILTDEDVTEALRIASEAQETADGKMTIYSTWGAWMKNNVNTLEVGDLFIPTANTTQGGVTYKANKVYKCTTDGSATFQAADYIDDAQAQAKIDAFVSNTYNPDKINLQSQIDGKAETFRQATDPSLDWYVEEGGEVTLDVRANHVGDLWMDISANGGKKTYIYEDNGESADPRYEWKAQEVPDEVFDEIDGKSTIFGNAIATPPTDYKKDDMWLLPAAATINGVSYKAGEVLSASQDSKTYSAAHWSKKIRYTDDTAFNGYIDAFLNGSSQSGDSFTAAAIQKAITSALGSALGSATITDGGLMLTSLIGMRQLNDGGDPSQISDYTTWAGISGQYIAKDAADPQNPTATWAKGHGIAAWYGGDMVDKEMLSQAQIDAGWGTGEGQYRWAKSVDRFDGSGYRANGNITWKANGELAISDITSIKPSGSNTNVLNDMIQFSNAFHFNTVQGGSTILNIVPQYPFYSLYLYDTSQPNNRSHVASQKWVDDNYVTKTFFRQLFRAFKPNATAGQDDVEVQPNTIDATISNIKAMVDFWSQGGITALGRGSGGGGGGGATTLYGLNDVSKNATGDGVLGAADGYVLTYNASTSHWYAAPTADTYVLPTATAAALGGIKIGYTTSGKNYAVQLANGQAFVNVPWENTTYTLAGLMGSTAIGGATQPIYWNGTAFANTTYTLGKSVPSDAVFTDTTYSFSNADATLAWSTRTKIATTGGTDIYVTMPANPDTNTWRNIFLSGAEKLTTGINTKGLNFVGDGKTTISFLAAGTGEGHSGNADYATLKISSTWRGIQDNLTSDSTTDSLSAKQGKTLKGYTDTLFGYFTSGVANSAAKLATARSLWGNSFDGTSGITSSIIISTPKVNETEKYLQIGDIKLVYDSENEAIYVVHSDDEKVANFYAQGGVSALGSASGGGGGGGVDMNAVWTALAASTSEQINASHLSTALSGYALASAIPTNVSQLTNDSGFITNSALSGYATQTWVGQQGFLTSIAAATASALGGIKVGYTTSGKNYKVQLDSSNNAYVNVPWENTTYTLAGLMGSSAKGSTTQPIYWTGSAFANTSYTLGKSVPSDAKFTDTTYSASTGLSLSGTAFSVSYAPKVLGSYTSNGGQQNPNYFGKNYVGFLMMNTTVNSNSQYKDWIIMDCYNGNDVGGGVAIGVNRQSLGAYIMRSAAERTSWAEKAELCGTHNSSVSLSGSTLTVKIAGVEKSLTNTNTWRGIQDNLTSSTNTTESLSAKQGYLLANGSARDSTKLPLAGGTMTGSITMSQGASARNVGIVGTYDYTKAAAIWCMGSSYQISSDGSGLGSLYGAAYVYQSQAGQGVMGGSHQFVWGINGTAEVALGEYVWARNGFKKNGSSDSYVLLGGGGHAAISGLSVSNADTVDGYHYNNLPYVPYSTTSASSSNQINLNDYFSSSSMKRISYDYAGSAYVTNRPYSSDAGAVINMPTYSGTQLYFNYYNNDVKIRTHYNGHITNWATFITSESIGSQSVNYATTSGSCYGNAANVTGTVAIGHGGTGATTAAAARANLGTWALISDTYDTLIKADGSTNGWIKIGKANSDYGIIPSQSGSAGSGHNYIGTSSWYWKYAYIDQIYGYLNGSISGSSTSCSGNAASATKLQTSRTIWGKSFDGSANISGTIYLDQNTPHYFRDPSNASWRGGMFWGSGSTESMSFVVVNSGTRFQFVGGSDIAAWGNSTWQSVTPWLEITSSGISSSGGVTALSDIRHKTIIDNTRLQVNDIARMRAVRYVWKDGREDKDMHVGSIAQDWQQILPEVVLRANNNEGTLSLQYGVAALISSITIARKVVDHEQRIKELERENKELREEISRLKIA